MKNTIILSILILGVFSLLFLGRDLVGNEYEEKVEQEKRISEIENMVDHMSIEEKVGQMLIPQLPSYNHSPTTDVNDYVKHILHDLHIGGVILFDKNIVNVEQLVTFTTELQNESNVPLFISIDQEGGKSTRKIGTQLPGNMALGATRSEELAFETGKILGRELQYLGVNVNFAPVLDVNSNPKNPVIGVRSFGDDPNLVGDLGISYMNGLQSTGIIPTVKHFPGHGDTEVDSHLGLPQLSVNRKRLESLELIPFKKAIENNADMIMTSHITFPKIEKETVLSKKDGSEITLPATLSKVILTDILRHQLNYDGVIITDSLEMKAIAEHFGEKDSVIKAINAGANILLMPTDIDIAHASIVKAVHNGVIEEKRIDLSVQRILSLKERYGLLEKSTLTQQSIQERVTRAHDVLYSEENVPLAMEIAKESVTLLKNKDEILPFSLHGEGRILVLVKNKEQELYVNDWFQQNGWEDNRWTVIKYENKLPTSDEYKAIVETASKIIFILEDVSVDKNSEDLIKKIMGDVTFIEKRAVALLAGLPYDIRLIPEVNAVVSVYGNRMPNIKAGLDVIFGQSTPNGQLPVLVPLNKGKNLEYGFGLSY